ncbi:hypothetical protein [Nonomuraea insulae]|uniref:Uncharacterized protein n=1 Tax=Nonomuraea insulae TaxID=1616787 RepID=A0ABW1D0B0_9ACTN
MRARFGDIPRLALQRLANIAARRAIDSPVEMVREGRMDVSAVVALLMPYVSAVIGAYGSAVLTKARDVAADETVGLTAAVHGCGLLGTSTYDRGSCAVAHNFD